MRHHGANGNCPVREASQEAADMSWGGVLLEGRVRGGGVVWEGRVGVAWGEVLWWHGEWGADPYVVRAGTPLRLGQGHGSSSRWDMSKSKIVAGASP